MKSLLLKVDLLKGEVSELVGNEVIKRKATSNDITEEIKKCKQLRNEYPLMEIQAIKKRDYSTKEVLTMKKVFASITPATIAIPVLYAFIVVYMVLLG